MHPVQAQRAGGTDWRREPTSHPLMVPEVWRGLPSLSLPLQTLLPTRPPKFLTRSMVLVLLLTLTVLADSGREKPPTTVQCLSSGRTEPSAIEACHYGDHDAVFELGKNRAKCK